MPSPMPSAADTQTVLNGRIGHNPADSTATSSWARKPWSDGALVALLLLVTLFCYANILTNSFVYDDDLQILQNPYVKSWRFLPEIFGTTVWSFVGEVGTTNYYRPLMTLSFLVLWKIFGPIPFGFHLFSLVVHAGVVVMMFYAGCRIFQDRRIAWLGALLFALHPIHTEAVDWIAAFPDLLSSFFFLAAFWVFAGSETPNWKQRIAAGALFVLAVLSKEPALMLVAVAVPFEHFVRPGRNATTLQQKFIRYAPLCLVGAAYLALRVALFGKLAPVLQHPQISWAQSIYSAFALVVDYVRLLVWPTRLSAFHVFHASSSLTEPRVLGGLVVVVLYVAGILVLRKVSAPAAFALLWLGVTLAPVLNARWMAANVLTERYLYLPSVGFCWLAAWIGKAAWDFLSEKPPSGRTPWRVALCATGIALAVLGTTKTWARNRIWRNDVTLYTKTLETDPDSYVMRMNLGISYFEMRDFSSSERELRRALELKPDSPNVLNALGCVYLEQGRLEEAATTFQKAIASKPGWTDSHFNYGRLLKQTGRNDAAVAEFRTAVDVGPLNATARLFLAQELEARGEDSEAEAEYRKSMQLSPSLTAEQNLVDILLRTGREKSAAEMLQQMATEYPYDSATHMRLGRLFEKERKTKEAAREYQATLVTDPANAEAQAGLQRLKNQAGR